MQYYIKLFINENYLDAYLTINGGLIIIQGQNINICKSLNDLTNCILNQNAIIMYFGNEQIIIYSNEPIILKKQIDDAKIGINNQNNSTSFNFKKMSLRKKIGIGIGGFFIFLLALSMAISNSNENNLNEKNSNDNIFESSENFENNKEDSQKIEVDNKEQEKALEEQQKKIEEEEKQKEEKEEKEKKEIIKNAKTIYYKDLINNYEKYIDKYVTISVPIDRISLGDVIVSKDIDSDFDISFKDYETYQNLKEGDYITVTGKVTKAYFYSGSLDNSYLIDSGKESKDLYKKQKEQYKKKQKEHKEKLIKKDKANKKEYKKSCSSIDYKKFARNPKKYIGKRVKLTVKVSQVMDGGLFDDGKYYHVFTDNSGYGLYLDDEYYIKDARTIDKTKILEDDIVTIYGKFTGTKELTRALTGVSEEVLTIDAKYIDIIE